MRNVFHLHLPKTAGMALHAFLVEQLGKNRVSPTLGGIRLSDALVQWQDIAAISGHFVARQGDLLPSSRFCITALRNPIDRLVSSFYYNKNDLDDLLLDSRRFTLSMDEFIQARTRAPVEESAIQLGMLYPLGTDSQARLTTDEKLAAATKALDQFDLVGVTEELDDFVVMLGAAMGWPGRSLDRVNITSRRVGVDALTTAQRTAIHRLLEPEILLYEHALTRFRRERRTCIGRSPGQGTNEIASNDARPKSTNNLPTHTSRDMGDLRCEITSVSVVGTVSGYQQVMAGELMNIIVEFIAHEPIDQLNAGIAINDERGVLMFGTNTLLQGSIISVARGSYAVSFSMLNRLGPGHYHVDAALIRTESHYDGCYHWRAKVSRFSVEAYAVQHYEGRVLMDSEVSFDGTSPEAVWDQRAVRPSNLFARSFGQKNEPLREFLSVIEPMVHVETLPRGVDTLLQVKLTNTGNETWVAGGRNPVHLSYHWRGLKDRAMVVADGLRTPLPQDVRPNESQICAAQVRSPKESGNYLLEISLVQEQVAWFSDRHAGSGCLIPIEVL
jgi:hypothetical protein